MASLQRDKNLAKSVLEMTISHLVVRLSNMAFEGVEFSSLPFFLVQFEPIRYYYPCSIIITQLHVSKCPNTNNFQDLFEPFRETHKNYPIRWGNLRVMWTKGDLGPSRASEQEPHRWIPFGNIFRITLSWFSLKRSGSTY